MRLITPGDSGFSVPVTITPPSAATLGARLGGRAPETVVPSRLFERGEYFATVPLLADLSLVASIFIGFGLDESLECTGDLASGTRLVEAIAHSPVPVRSDDLYASTIALHGLSFQAARPDFVVGPKGERVIRSSHKLGGQPYIMRDDHLLVEQLGRLAEAGFVQVAQFDFPGFEDDPVTEEWPFGDGVFHMLGKPPFRGADDWRAFWEN